MIRKLYSMFKSYCKRVGPYVVVIAISVLACDYIRLHLEFRDYKMAHQESIAFLDQVRSIKVSLAQIDQFLTRINKFSSKLKVLAKIPQRIFGSKFAKRSMPYGFGLDSPGLDSPVQVDTPKTHVNDIPEEDYVKLKKKYDLESLQLRLDRLLAETERQEKSLAELSEFYSDHKLFLASVPSLSPAEGRITSSFGFRRHPNDGHWQMHEGVDIAASYGSSVITPADGLVEKVVYSPGYGHHLIIDHGYGLKSTFAHAREILVKPGQYVKRGSRIALVGKTGKARGVHLHYGMTLNGVPVDPSDYMFN